MRLMTREQREVLDKLIQLAEGNELLVMEAIEVHGKGRPAANITDVIAYIKDRTHPKKNSASAA